MVIKFKEENKRDRSGVTRRAWVPRNRLICRGH